MDFKPDVAPAVVTGHRTRRHYYCDSCVLLRWSSLDLPFQIPILQPRILQSRDIMSSSSAR